MAIKCLLFMAVAAACGAQNPPAHQPVFKLLYSPTTTTTIGAYPDEIFEAKPGLLYVSAQSIDDSHGSSVFSLTSQGAFTPIYSLPVNTISAAFAQSVDAKIYEPAFFNESASGKGNYYLSFTLQGTGVERYRPPAGWGSTFQIISAPPGVFYDILGYPQPGTTPELWALGRIDVDGSITIVHQFSGTDGCF